MRARVVTILTCLAVLVGPVALGAVACARRAPASTTSALTGLPLGAGDDGPLLAVKIDNARGARPWSGLEAADVVYVEPVEGGATRLLAIFSSRRPPSVGPVRSFRESDLEVLSAYGRPGLVYSGAAPELSGALAAASVVPLSPATVPAAFRRDPDRTAPDNLYADPAALAAAAGGAGPVTSAGGGFTFGSAPAGGTASAGRSVAVGSTRVGAEWDAAAGRWSMSFDGRAATARDGTRLAAATVVVQTVRITASSVSDVAGRVSPKAETVGEGAADVLRDGQVFGGRWSRASAGSGTTVTGNDGAPIAFRPGPVWVLLVPAG